MCAGERYCEGLLRENERALEREGEGTYSSQVSVGSSSAILIHVHLTPSTYDAKILG